MTRHARVVKRLAALAVAALVLAGCSDEANPQPPASSSGAKSAGVQSDGAKSGGAESEGADAEEQPSGDPTVETDDGGEVVTSGQLTQDFPKKKVPVLPGTVLSAASSPDAGFNVVILVDGSPKKVSTKAVKKLKKAGFMVKSKRVSSGGVVTVLASADFKVEVAATQAGPQTSVNYAILKR